MVIKNWIFSLLVAYSITSVESQKTVPSDCTSTLSIYKAMGGVTSLTQGCSLPGVTSTKGIVTSINWSNLGLKGNLSNLLGKLTGLHILRLNDNNLTGPIPVELGKLVNLKELYLQNNNLFGTIPSSVLSLKAMKVLEPQRPSPDCKLVNSIFKAMGGVARSEEMMGMLKARNFAENDGCSLSGVHSSFGVVTNIVFFRRFLYGKIPPEIGRLKNLTTLILGSNQLNGSIPAEIFQLKYLQILDLSGNQITGSIPTAIVNLRDLQKLYLGSNGISGTIPPQIGQLKKLTNLDLDYNQLTGQIPSVITSLTTLIGLSIRGNKLYGSIPPGIGALTGIKSLLLGSNQFTGPIPRETGKLRDLEWLDMSRNNLSGNIPVEIGNLRNLVALSLHQNQLTGAPSSLSKLINTEKYLFPNPIRSIPYDVFAQSTSATLSPTNWTNLLNVPVLVKRQQLSSLSTKELLAMCPLNNFRDVNVPAGCIAGIYNKYCLDSKNLISCQASYDTVVASSYFKPLGVCAAWKSGPRSSDCSNAISNFRHTLPYMTLTKTHASDFARTIYGSQKYAPCMTTSTVKCNW